jgi:cell division protein FtsB
MTQLLAEISTADAQVLVALAGVGGVAISKAFDALVARFSANPPDNGAFRDYLKNKVNKLEAEVRALARHISDCERDRALLTAKNAQLEAHNTDLERRIALLEGQR